MEAEKNTLTRLQQLDTQRQQLRQTEEALELLTPEERLAAQLLLIAPSRGNSQRLCQLLDREPSSIYRLRSRTLQKLTAVLYPNHQQ